MTSLTSKILLECRSPSLQFRRFRGKINIQRPQKVHYDRALFNAVTEPKYIQPSVTQKCFDWHQKQQQQQQQRSADTTKTGRRKQQIENPYEAIIAKEVANWFSHSQLIAFFHVNSISADDMFKARVAFHKQNMHVKVYGKEIIRQAIANTKYEAAMPLFESKDCILFSTEPKLTQMLKITKKIPQMLLLAGIVQDRLMSKNELTAFAALPSLDVARAQLVAVLQRAGGANVLDHLQAHQTQLCGSLDAFAKQGSDEAATNEETK